MSYFRDNIEAMHGYTPGEQPQGRVFTKLNTNENPYPPSKAVREAYEALDFNRLGRYPDPMATAVRQAAAEIHKTTPDQILVGNGSDDILTIAVRAFVDQGGSLASLDPSYSLYPVLAEIQGARIRYAPLDESFRAPQDLLRHIEGASLFFLTRPNAPTGLSMCLDDLRALCAAFPGVVLIDEAYADFAQDQADGLVSAFPNVIISRTLSKSYSLAGIRLGYAYAQRPLIDGMLKVKDSYNVNMITQALGAAALRDQVHMHANAHRIRHTRDRISHELHALGFQVLPSEANFLLAKPPVPAANLKAQLQQAGVLVRHFDLPRVRDYIRVTVGTDAEMAVFMDAVRAILQGET